MLTILCLGCFVALITIASAFALIGKNKVPEGQTLSFSASSDGTKVDVRRGL
jgi:hypothetical protein